MMTSKRASPESLELAIENLLKHFQLNARYQNQVGNEGWEEERRLAHTAITSLIQREVLKGRLDELERLYYVVVNTDKAMGGGKKTLNLETLGAYVALRKLELEGSGILPTHPGALKEEVAKDE